MTRRRGGGRSGRLTADDMWSGDGIDSLFDGGRRAESYEDAARQWETLRHATWRLWAEHPSSSPPMAAETHDGLRRPEDIAEFRARRPAAAASIADELAQWSSVVEAERAFYDAIQTEAAAQPWRVQRPALGAKPDPLLAPVLPIRTDPRNQGEQQP